MENKYNVPKGFTVWHGDTTCNPPLELQNKDVEGVVIVLSDGQKLFYRDPNDLDWDTSTHPQDIIAYKKVYPLRDKATKHAAKLIKWHVKQLIAEGYRRNNGYKGYTPYVDAIEYARVDIIMRYGDEVVDAEFAKDLRWNHMDLASDIFWYRLSRVCKGDIEESKQTLEKITPARSINPKESIGAEKLSPCFTSPLLVAAAALGKQNGAMKYGGANFIGTEVSMMTYLNAIQRHFHALLMGEDCDKIDGVPHIGAIAAGLDILLCAEAAGTLVDDRLRHDGQLARYEAMYENVAKLKTLHEGKNPKHYYAKDAQ